MANLFFVIHFVSMPLYFGEFDQNFFLFQYFQF